MRAGPRTITPVTACLGSPNQTNCTVVASVMVVVCKGPGAMFAMPIDFGMMRVLWESLVS